MIIASTQRAIGFVVLAVVVIGFVVVAHRQPPSRSQRGRLRDRAGAQPQAVPDRRRARGQEAQPRAVFGRRPAGDHRRRAPALLAGRAGPPGRRGRGCTRRPSPAARPGALRRPSAQCVTCHGGAGIGGVHDLRRQRPERSVRRPGHLDRPGAQQRPVPLLRGRGALHPQLRPSGHADGRPGAAPVVARSPTSSSTTSSTTSGRCSSPPRRCARRSTTSSRRSIPSSTSA